MTAARPERSRAAGEAAPVTGRAGPATRPLVPRWFRRTVAYAGGLLVVGALAWAVVWVLLQVALVTFALVVALLLAALLDPLARLLHRALPAWAAALLSLLLLLAVVLGAGYLVASRVAGQIGNLTTSLTASVDQIRGWLVNGPLSLQPQQVDQVRDQAVGAIQSRIPSGVTAAGMLLSAGSGMLIALFVLSSCSRTARACGAGSSAPRRRGTAYGSTGPVGGPGRRRATTSSGSS